jgi:DNA gyrase subunit A
MGVRGINLGLVNENTPLEYRNRVVGMLVVKDPNTQVLTLSEKGIGKRSPVSEYRLTSRGSKGVKTIQVTPKTGNLVAVIEVQEDDQLMVITRDGITIRTPIKDIREAGRATQGVKIINLKANDSIAAITKIAERDDEEELEGAQGEDSANDNAATPA